MRPRSRLAQQIVDLPTENRQVSLDHALHEPMVHASVAMDQDVPKGDDIAMPADARGETRIQLGELRHGFADHLELPLDGRAQHDVGQVLLEVSASSELRDQRRRLLDVVEVCPSLTLQRRAPSIPPRPRGSSDS